MTEGHATEADNRMHLTRLGAPENMWTIALQLGAGLGLLVAGAKGFIHAIEGVSAMLGISALLLSLLIIPIATELPEKVNSILWIRRSKDTLAFGNITGAMVFQGTLLPAIGILLTPWQPRVEILGGVAFTLVAAVWLRANAGRDGLRVWALLVNGALYIGYIALTLTAITAGHDAAACRPTTHLPRQSGIHRHRGREGSPRQHGVARSPLPDSGFAWTLRMNAGPGTAV